MSELFQTAVNRYFHGDSSDAGLTDALPSVVEAVNLIAGINQALFGRFQSMKDRKAA